MRFFTGLKNLWHRLTQKSSTDVAKVAFITAIYGDYEASCKKFASQSISTDFICFTNNPEIKANGWIIDTTPYHKTHPSPVDQKTYVNSLHNNTHTFNIAKYYKQNFYHIPRLQQYEVIIWVDGTIEITHPDCVKYALSILKDYSIITMENECLTGKLKDEVKLSIPYRYYSTHWFGQDQPYQDLAAQYKAYVQSGYKDAFWKKYKPSYTNANIYGMWCTCLVVFDMRYEKMKDFLDFWYLQTLQYSTQDQMGFPFALQKKNIIPYTWPDYYVQGKSHSKTDFYIKHEHGN